MCSLPLPPDDLERPNVLELPAREVLHRVHGRTFSGNAFNPCRGGETRFAPIHDIDGRCAPSLYAAATVIAAIYETVFHDIPLTGTRKTVPRAAVASRQHSVLLVGRPLRLASLRAPDLMKWGIDRDDLIGGPPTRFRTTAQWAQAIHHRSDDVDGLVWTSKRSDPDTALLFFGDRVVADDVQVVAVRDGTDPSFLADVHAAGRRSGIRITL